MTAASADLQPTTPAGAQTGSLDRQQRLAGAVARLRTRSGDGSLDRWLLVIGGTLMPLGLLFILLGWYGVAHKPQLYSQMSYLISGGVLGLGLLFAGGFTYFAYWLTKLVRDNRAAADRTADALSRLETLLASGLVTVPAASTDGASRPGRVTERPLRPAAVSVRTAATGSAPPADAPGRPVAAVTGPAETFVATPSGSMLHRPDCPVVVNRDGLKPVAAGEPGYSACRICEPLAG